MTYISQALKYLYLSLDQDSPETASDYRINLSNAIVELELAIEYTSSEMVSLALVDIINSILNHEELELIISELELIQSEL